jgi:hypothetical protein
MYIISLDPIQVELRRFEQFGVMIIDSGLETRNGSSPGAFTALNINNGYLFLGGIPEFINYVALFPGGEEVTQTLIIYYHYQSFSSPLVATSWYSSLLLWNLHQWRL